MVQIQEFWTFVTDLVLSLQCAYCAYNIRHIKRSAHISSRAWFYIFIAISVAAMAGAIHHGFKHILPIPVYDSLRLTVLLCLNTTAFLLSRSLLFFALPSTDKWHSKITGFLALKLIIFIVFAFVERKFIVGLVDYASAFIIAFFIFTALRSYSGARWMLAGVCVSLFAASIQVLKIAPSEEFNHNDLYHVIQMFGIYLFYKGAPQLQDRIA